MPNEFVMVYITTPNESEALGIAHTIVEEQLAACANIIPNMKSVYIWKGASVVDTEVILIFKTVASKFEQLKKRVVELHSYELPCIISIPINQGHQPYFDWIADQTLN